MLIIRFKYITFIESLCLQPRPNLCDQYFMFQIIERVYSLQKFDYFLSVFLIKSGCQITLLFLFKNLKWCQLLSIWIHGCFIHLLVILRIARLNYTTFTENFVELWSELILNNSRPQQVLFAIKLIFVLLYQALACDILRQLNLLIC